MPFTAQEIITEAYSLSGIVSLDYQSVSGSQITRGLTWLNNFLAEKGIHGDRIPYYREHVFTVVPHSIHSYIFSAISIETVTFELNTIRYSLKKVDSRKKFLGDSRAMAISSLPYEWYVERDHQGVMLYLYWLPKEAYTFTAWGKFYFPVITSLSTDLVLFLETSPYFLQYATYGLANDICGYYNRELSTTAKEKLESFEEALQYISPKDFSQQKISTFNRETYDNYAIANFGTGWSPR